MGDAPSQSDEEITMQYDTDTYPLTQFTPGTAAETAYLAAKGQQGWVLCTVVVHESHVIYYWKRP